MLRLLARPNTAAVRPARVTMIELLLLSATYLLFAP
jgi:hypothetical protein